MTLIAQSNSEFLTANLVWAYTTLRIALERKRGEADVESLARERTAAAAAVERFTADESVPFARLARSRGLVGIEAELIRMCLARRIDPAIGQLLADLHGDPERDQLQCVDVATLWEAPGSLVRRVQLLGLLSPRSKLRAARIVDVFAAAQGLFLSPITLTPACETLLLGLEPDSPYLHYEPRSPSPARAILPPEQRQQIFGTVAALAQAFASDDQAVTRGAHSILALLWGPHHVGKRTLAREIVFTHFGGVVDVDCESIADAADPARVLRDAVDHAILREAALVLRNGHALFKAGPFARCLLNCLDGSGVSVFVTASERDLNPALESEWLLVAHIEAPRRQSRQLWEANLPQDLASGFDLAAVSERYHLSAVSLARASRVARALRHGEPGGALTSSALERAAALQLDGDMGSLVRTIHPEHAFESLVLPEDLLESIAEIVDAYFSWHHLMGEWGLGGRMSTGKCISCLFSGDPGTGKTYAAEVIASLIKEPLHIVALPSILSKWVGETERNIAQLFARAQMNSAVMLFDEADSLFASRVEAKTSHDHDRNMLTGSLLQELDRHTGLVIMTTNFIKNIDRAFQRRIMFHLEFPLPDVVAREALWRGLVPSQMPCDSGVSFSSLATSFDLSGGEIKNAMVRAAAMAWSRSTAVTHELLVAACEQEYRRTGKLFQRRDPSV